MWIQFCINISFISISIYEHDHAIPFHINNVKQIVEKNSKPTELRHEMGKDKISEIKKKNIIDTGLH